jgi:tetrachlorobenzoquinone reductase
MTPEDSLRVRLNAIRYEAENINAYEFVAPDGAELPPFTAGAHIEVDLGNGMTRCYSLSNAPSDRKRYVIAVAMDANGKGGSRYFHEHAQVGKTYRIVQPRNNFPLAASDGKSVLIAGGIGITPIWSMARHLEESDRPWKMYYRARGRRYAALLGDPFYAEHKEKIEVVYDDDLVSQGIGFGDYIPAIVNREGNGCHFYCCGPAGMLENFKQATSHLPPESVHLEHFGAVAEKSQTGGFDLILAKCGVTVKVQPGKTILDTLLDNGIDVMNSCREGVCGACEVRVVDGIPDHRDAILSDAEKAAGKTMFVCCSGSLSPSLTLDL